MPLPRMLLAFGRSVVLPRAVLVSTPLPRLPFGPFAFLGSTLPMVDLAFLRSPALPIAPLVSPMLPILVFLGSMPLPSTVLLASGALPSRFLPGWLLPRFPGRPLPRFGKFFGVTTALVASFLPDKTLGSFFLGSSVTPFFLTASRRLRGSNWAAARWPPANPKTAIASTITIDPAKTCRLVRPGPRNDMAQTLVCRSIRRDYADFASGPRVRHLCTKDKR